MIVAIAATAYVASYFVLMDRKVPAFDDYGNRTFDSSFRFAPSVVRNNGDVTWLYAKQTLFNWLFYPLDKVCNAER